MKNLTQYQLLLSISILFSVNTAALAAEDYDPVQDSGGNIIIQYDSNSYFKSMLYNVWGRLQALNSQHTTGSASGNAVVTIGIRGARLPGVQSNAEGDDTAVNMADNEELVQFVSAQRYAETGQLEQAVSELDSFIDKYQDSELRPNALFALGISQAGLWEYESSKLTLIDFVDEYPAHPLTADAERILEEYEIMELLGD